VETILDFNTITMSQLPLTLLPNKD